MTSLVVAAVPAHASSSILGGGSGFAALEIDQWRADTARSPFNLNVDYVAQGSTFGRSQFQADTFDYGASDIQYPQEEIPGLENGRCQGKTLAQCFVYVPVSAGGLAFMYNLVDSSGQPITNLKLTRDDACRIFTGQILKWNDPKLVRDNPELASHNTSIRPVVRADGAGESFVLSEFCIAVAHGVWSTFVQDQVNHSSGGNTIEFQQGLPTSSWPTQFGNAVTVPFADGVAAYVGDPSGGLDTIGYDAAGYAKVRNLPTASLQNASGAFTQPDEDNVTHALHFATANGNGTFTLHFDGADPTAYFPSTYSYVLAQTTGFDPGKGAALGQFLCYAISKGQESAVPLRYARLSDALVNIATAAIVQIPGAPSASDCFVKGSKPPPSCPQCGGGGGPGVVTTTTVPGQTPDNPSGTLPNGQPRGTKNGRGPGGSVSLTGKCTAVRAPKTTTTKPATTTTTVKGTTTTKATTTTTVKVTTTIPCRSSANGGSGAVGGNGNGASNTPTTVSLDAQLAAAKAAREPKSGGTSSTLVLFLGVVLAAALTGPVSRAARRRGAS